MDKMRGVANTVHIEYSSDLTEDKVALIINNAFGFRFGNQRTKGERIMDSVQAIWEWIKARFTERTPWDGVLLIVMGLMILVGGPIMKVLAVGAIGWGCYTIFMKRKASDDLPPEDTTTDPAD